MNRGVLVLVALLFAISPALAVSSLFDDYTNIREDTSMHSCITPYLDGTNLNMKVSVDMDAPDVLSRAWCPYGGILFNMPYTRQLWMKTTVVNDLASKSFDLPYNSAGSDFNLLNFNQPRLGEVFTRTPGSNTGINLVAVSYDHLFTNSYISTANNYLAYKVTASNTFPRGQVPLYYALAHGSVGYGVFYDNAAHAFVTQSEFEADGLAYPPTDLSNPSELLKNGHAAGQYQLVNPSQMDLEMKNAAGSAFFAFDDSLQYYALPYYVDAVNYVIKGYDGTGAGKNETFSKSGIVSYTSSAVYFPEVTPGGPTQITGASSAQYIPSFKIPDDLLAFGTQIRYDGAVAALPANTQSVAVALTMTLKRNPFYRERSPADWTWYMSNLTDDASGLFNQNTLLDVQLAWSQTMNVSTFATNISNAHPDNDNASSNDYSTTPYDGTGPSIPSTDTTNSSNATGTDWARDTNSGGGLAGQYEYARGLETARDKGSFFDGLATVADVIFRIALAVFLLSALFVSVFALFILVPSAYRKLVKELKKLGDQKWD